MSGWLRLWRKIRENFLWRQHRRFSWFEAWLDLLLGAAYHDHEVLLGSRLLTVKRGQVLLSARKKALEWVWARNTVLHFFLLLERERMLRREVSHGPDGGYTLLTILNYEKYQGLADEVDLDDLSHGVGHDLSHARATVRPRTDPNQEGKEGKEPFPTCGLTLAQYLEKHSPEGQEVLRQTLQAIASTRKSGKVAQSVLNALAGRLDRYQPPVVLQACRIYLGKDYAGQGKREEYLLGIVRGEARRSNGNGREADPYGTFPHTWQCQDCGQVHEGTRPEVGSCLAQSAGRAL